MVPRKLVLEVEMLLPEVLHDVEYGVCAVKPPNAAIITAINKQIFLILLIFLVNDIRFALIIAVRCRVAEEQPVEYKLLRKAVAFEQLCRYVQEPKSCIWIV